MSSDPFRVLSLFSGVGMHDLGFQRAGMTIAGQCEISDHRTRVLEKHWPGLPRWKDVRDVRGSDVIQRCGRINLLTGGFMCTDISNAGDQAGIGRETRSGSTWRNFFRLARQLRPDWLLLENVSALKSHGYDRIAPALERIGYALRPLVVGAWTAGSPHLRERVWVVANALHVRAPRPIQSRGAGPAGPWRPGGPEALPDWRTPWDRVAFDGGSCPALVSGVGNGPADWVDRVAALGDGNPPVVPFLIASWILAQERGAA